MKKYLIILFVLMSTVSFGQVVNTVSGIDTTLGDGNGYDVNSLSETELTVEWSKISQPNGGTYLLKCGIDSYNSDYAHNLDSAIIEGNFLEFTGTLWTGSIHTIMAGYNLDYQIRYNYLKHGMYGVVAEAGYQNGDSMVNENYNIFGNIFNNVSMPMSAGGYDGINFFNNTVYLGRNTTLQMVKNIPNEYGGLDFPAYGKNIKIYNNIFYTVHNKRIIAMYADCSEGFECDYNLYFVENAVDNEPTFIVNGVQYTWDEWQGLGYDTHSYILDPQFLDTINFVPGVRLNYGVDLGDQYDQLISTGCDWGVGDSLELTAQNGSIQVGARIHPADTTIGDYFISELGDDDTGNGSYKYPWETFQKLINECTTAGDTGILRGGVWTPSNSDTWLAEHKPQNSKGDSGAYGSPIVFMNYPTETPIFDCKNKRPSGINVGLDIQNTDHVIYKGFVIRNLHSFPIVGEMDVLTINATDNGHITFDRITIHDIGGRGFWATRDDSLYYYNCDAYNLCDSLDINSPGGDADGWNISSGVNPGVKTYMVVEIKGCRAWNCSDDGFDIANQKAVYIDTSWSFFNGSLYEDEAYRGDGTGFKFANTDDNMDDPLSKKKVTRTITAYNSGAGLEINNISAGAGVYATWYNNTVYNNHIGLNTANGSPGTWTFPADSGRIVCVNNLVYKYTREAKPYSDYLTAFTGGAATSPQTYVFDTTETWQFKDGTHWYNEYNPTFTITDGDFVSVDSALIYSQLSASRNADGSLPDITVLTLDSGSDLIDGGTDVGYGDDVGALQAGDDPASSDKDVISINCAGQVSSAINNTTHTITVNLGWGYDKDDVTVYNLNVSPGASHNLTATDFTSPITVRVTAADESTQDYTMTVTEPAAFNIGGKSQVKNGKIQMIRQ